MKVIIGFDQSEYILRDISDKAKRRKLRDNAKDMVLVLLSFLYLYYLACPTKAETVTYKLVNGDMVSGKLDKEASSNEKKILESPHLGRLEIPAKIISKVIVTNPWRTDFRFGFSGTNTGIDRDFGFNTSLNSQYRDDLNTYTFGSSYEYGTSDDSANKGFAGLRYDRLFSKSLWGLYAISTYDYNADNTSGVNSSFSSIGLSYQLVKLQKTSITLSSGPAIRWQGGGNQCASDQFCGRTDPAALVELAFEWKPSKLLSFSLRNQLRPVWYEDLRYANTIEAAFRIVPSVDSNIFTEISARSIYDETKSPEWDNSFLVQLGATL